MAGGIRRLGGPRDGGSAGDGDPGGGAARGESPGQNPGQDPGQDQGQDPGEELVARLLLGPAWAEHPQQPLPAHLGVAGTLAELRQLSDSESALLNLGGELRGAGRESGGLTIPSQRSSFETKSTLAIEKP